VGNRLAGGGARFDLAGFGGCCDAARGGTGAANVRGLNLKTSILTTLSVSLVSITAAHAGAPAGTDTGAMAPVDRFADRPIAVSFHAGLTTTGPLALEAAYGFGRHVVVAGQIGPGYGDGQQISAAAKLRLQYASDQSAVGLAVGPTTVVTGMSDRNEAERETKIAAEAVGEWRTAKSVTFRLAAGLMKSKGEVEGWPLVNAGVGYAF
jgi:hypothetical protein